MIAPPGHRPRALVVWIASCSLASALLSDPAGAQARPSLSGRITGVVVDADSEKPIPDARVELEALGAGSLDREAARTVRFAITDTSGAYGFTDVGAGSFRVRVERPGYAPAAVDIAFLGLGESRVTIGLRVQPIVLQPLEVLTEMSPPYRRVQEPPTGGVSPRVQLARARQDEYLDAGSRVLSSADVWEAVTLAEPDIFRALQRAPGVGTRDDYTATLWVRGAPWVQTRVYFDELPLYNPTHAGWLFSSINPAAVGEALFHPGVRPASLGEGAAAVLDLRSRRGGRDDLNASADVSLASAQLSLDGSLPGDGRWMVAGRRTYVDLVTRAYSALSGDESLHIPYDFSDLTARVDLPLFHGVGLEASGLAEHDRLRGDIHGFVEGNRARWGNRAGRITLSAPLGPLQVRVTRGATRFRTLVVEDTLVRSSRIAREPALIPAMENGIDHDRVAIRVAPLDRARGTAWSAGAERVQVAVTYDGPFSLTAEGIPGLPRDSVSPFRFSRYLEYDAVWAERRISLLDRIDLQLGLRLEFGDSVLNAGERRWAPRISIRWRHSESLSTSLGWGRSYQYTQAIGAAGGPLGPQLHLSHLWVLSEPRSGYPAIRSDIATLGLERWLKEEWLLTGNVYYRAASGVTEPDPTPGPIFPDRFKVDARNRASGVELSAQRLTGHWTGSLSYSHGRSEMEAPGVDYPSSSDIRHTFDATLRVRATESVLVGSAFSYASGVPYTRVLVGSPPVLGEPNARRTPPYASLDLMAEYGGARFHSVEMNVYVQLRNALGRANAVTYAGSACSSGTVASACPESAVVDRFEAGLPRLPLLGIRLKL